MQNPSASTQRPNPPMKSALATMTPSAPPSGTCRSASIAYERPAILGNHPALDVLNIAGEHVAGDRWQKAEARPA